MKIKQKGFTLIELLVVVAIIALLSSVALIALQSARQKSRDTKRLADMTQIATAMELYFNTNKGYPSSTSDLVPGFATTLPSNPQPPDGVCSFSTYPVDGVNASQYDYYPSPTGGSYVLGGLTMYPDYIMSFCLGNQTGNFAGGVHQLTPKGVR